MEWMKDRRHLEPADLAHYRAFKSWAGGMDLLENGGRLARKQTINEQKINNMALVYPDAGKAMRESVYWSPVRSGHLEAGEAPQRPGSRSSLVNRPQDRMPVPACAQDTPDRKVTVFNLGDD